MFYHIYIYSTYLCVYMFISIHLHIYICTYIYIVYTFFYRWNLIYDGEHILPDTEFFGFAANFDQKPQRAETERRLWWGFGMVLDMSTTRGRVEWIWNFFGMNFLEIYPPWNLHSWTNLSVITLHSKPVVKSRVSMHALNVFRWQKAFSPHIGGLSSVQKRLRRLL